METIAVLRPPISYLRRDMELLEGPVWSMEDVHKVNPQESFVRIRLYEDRVIAEFTLAELCSFFGIDGIDCLRRQFEVWREIGAFTWNLETKVHLETRPFKEYFSKSKLAECYAPQPLPEPIDGKIVWGMKKK